MKKILLTLFTFVFLASPTLAHAAAGFTEVTAFSIGINITGFSGDCGDMGPDVPQNLVKYDAGECEMVDGVGVKSGLLPVTGRYMAMLFEQPSGREYVADLLDNIGIPTISRAYAQGTGYQAMSPFLSFWKVFRNLAYSLYIIMFIVVGIMIMLRTKVNAQTIISIQSALPNLLITLLLITFSYAIVGFMIDIMYFLIYFIVYLMASINLIETPTLAISRLMDYSAWGVIFGGRNSLISGVGVALTEIVTGANSITAFIDSVPGVSTIANILANSFFYLLAALWLTMTMLKLMWLLLKSYLFLILQVVTAPLQILMNAIPGSKAFSEWLKKTAAYLLAFPVAAAMFILAAVFIGDPTQATLFKDVYDADGANPFGINQNHEFYAGTENNTVWLPPFTLNGTSDWNSKDIMILLGFFIFTMTPAAIKMAQDWLQTKESPYSSEITAGLGAAKMAYDYPAGIVKGYRQQAEQRSLMKEQAGWIGDSLGKGKTTGT